MIKKLITLLLFCLNLFAVEDTSYEQIVQEAIFYNKALKKLELDKQILDAKYKEEYGYQAYPSLSLSFDTQYNKDLENEDSGLSSIGDSIFPDETKYANSTKLDLYWDIYDFGRRDILKKISLIQKKQKDYEIEETSQKLKLDLLKYYLEILKNKKELKHIEDSKELNQNIYAQKKRLYEANQLDRLSLANEAIKIVEYDRKISSLKTNINKSIKEINFYTNKQYSINTNFKSFKNNVLKDIPYEKSFLSKKYKDQIKQKKEELLLVKKEQYPSLAFFGNYNLYKDDESSFNDSLHLKRKNYLLGLKVKINLFQGYKYKAQKDRIKAELQKIYLEDEEQKDMYYKNKIILKEEFKSVKNDIANIKENISQSKNKTEMINRLKEVKNIDNITVIEDKIDNINKDLDFHSSKITKQSIKKQMEILGVKDLDFNTKKIDQKDLKKEKEELTTLSKNSESKTKTKNKIEVKTPFNDEKNKTKKVVSKIQNSIKNISAKRVLLSKVLIQVGEELDIGNQKTYKVKSGNTFSKIANNRGLTTRELLELNTWLIDLGRVSFNQDKF
ncbi:MAG: TolC family protein [Arcobacter sp.]|nr:TolC family protein [Arcobacter sp.]